MPQLNVNGTQLHYQSLGQGSTVVMIHGLLLGNLASWYFGIAMQLAERHRVLLYDLRGHGLSEMSRHGYDQQTMVDDLEALLAHEGIGEVTLVGHSYGAMLAFQFALRDPQRVKKIVCVEGPWPLARGLEMDEFMGTDPEVMLSALPLELQKSLGSGSRQGRKLQARLHFLLQETGLLQQLKSEPEVSDQEWASLRQPILLIYGSHSKLADVPARLQKKLPSAQLSWLPGGHYLPSELPMELGRQIGAFIS